MSSVKPEEVTDIEVEEGGRKDSIGFKFKHVPKKADTGVDEAITTLGFRLQCLDSYIARRRLKILTSLKRT